MWRRSSLFGDISHSAKHHTSLHSSVWYILPIDLRGCCVLWLNLLKRAFCKDVLSAVHARVARKSTFQVVPIFRNPTRVAIRLERELEESGAAEEGEVKVEVLEGGPDKTGGGILVAMAKAGASRFFLIIWRGSDAVVSNCSSL